MNEVEATSPRDARRIQAGLSRAELARRSGVHVDTVRAILLGKEGQSAKVRAVDDALDAALGGAKDGLVELEVTGTGGASVVVRGDVGDLDSLEALVLRLVAQMNSEH